LKVRRIEMSALNPFAKPEELETSDRPFRVHWHGRFLRSWKTMEELKDSLNFFNSFLIEITHKEVR
jgi:hypothetical protein